jgi:hypothetical protein
MNLKDSIANKIYYLILAEVLARDNFISKPVTSLFSCGVINKSSYLSYLILFEFFFFVAKIFRGWGLPLSVLIHITEGSKAFPSFLLTQMQSLPLQ